MADLTSLYADRASLGVTDTLVPTSPLRLVGTPAASVGALRLALDGNGNVTSGVLVAGDIPSVFPRRDVDETISGSWTWSSGKTIAFAAGPLAAPLPTSRSLGTRLVLEPVAGSTEYAIGRETGKLWTSTPLGAAHSWYTGATERLRLDTDGTLRVINGSGILTLARASDGAGGVVASNVLLLGSDTANVSFQTGNGLILPTLNYKENLGALHRKYLTLHAAELWVETLVAQNTMATIGGRILIGPTTTLMADVPAIGVGPGPGYEQTIQVKHNQIQVGDFLWLEANGQFEIMQALYTPGGSSPPYHYIVGRNKDGSGLSDWYAGDAVFNTGQTGKGFIDLYSVSGVNAASTEGPTIVGHVRTANTPTAWEPRWAVGNLKGHYGNASAIYGAAFGHPSGGLHVQVDATNGIRFVDAAGTPYSSWDMTGAIRIGYSSTPNIYISPTGSIELRKGSTTTIKLDATSGDLMLTGNLRGGATAFGTTAGYWLGWSGAGGTGVPQFRVGDPLGNRLEWDGTNLTIVSGNVQIHPSTGITIKSSPGGLFTPSYGYNLTDRIYGGTCAVWGWESGLQRKLEITNETAPLSNASSAVRISVLGYGGTGTQGARIDLESYASQPSLFRAVCGDVQLGGTLAQTLTFKAGGNQSFRVHAVPWRGWPSPPDDRQPRSRRPVASMAVRLAQHGARDRARSGGPGVQPPDRNRLRREDVVVDVAGHVRPLDEDGDRRRRSESRVVDRATSPGRAVPDEGHGRTRDRRDRSRRRVVTPAKCETPIDRRTPRLERA